MQEVAADSHLLPYGSKQAHVVLCCRTYDRGGKYSMLEPIRLPLMEVVDEVVVSHVPAPGGSKDWNVQHVEVTWWGLAGVCLGRVWWLGHTHACLCTTFGMVRGPPVAGRQASH